MARDRLAALRSQNSLDSPANSPQPPSNVRRPYPESSQRPPYQPRGSPYSRGGGDPRSSRPYSDGRSPPPSDPPRRDWTPEPFYDDRQGYFPTRAATTSPSRTFHPQGYMLGGGAEGGRSRVSSPDQFFEAPRVQSPVQMSNAPRDFDPNTYQAPRDFNPNDPDGGEVRHRNVGRRYHSREEEEDVNEKHGYRYGTSSKGTTEFMERDGLSSRKRSDSDQGMDSMPVLNNSKHGNSVSRGEVPYEDMSEFFAEVTTIQDDIKEASATIDLIHNLYARYLACPSSEDVQALALHDQLGQKTSSTRGLFASLRNRLHVLEQGNANLAVMIPLGLSAHQLSMSDVSVRQQQVQNVKSRFKDAIQRYAEVEKDNRSKNRAKMERQVRVVYPQLSYEELQQIVRQAEMEGGSALFAQAVRSNGYRTRQAQSALREVQTRAAELSRIEETLTELAQMFADMATLVEAQDIAITKIEDDAQEAQLDMEIGLENTKKAVHHARMARKRRWICFFIFVIIVIVLTVVLVLKVILPAVNKSKNDSNSDPSQTSNIASNGNGNSSPQGSKAPVVPGAVTVTVTTTVVVVRQPAASLNALAVETPTSRAILMTVDAAVLASIANYPVPLPSPTPHSSASPVVPPSRSSTSKPSLSSRPLPTTNTPKALVAVSASRSSSASGSGTSSSPSRSRSENRSSFSTVSRHSLAASPRHSSAGTSSHTTSRFGPSTASSAASRQESSASAHTSSHRPSPSRSTLSGSQSSSISHSHSSSVWHSGSSSHSHSSASSSTPPRSAASTKPRSFDPLLSASNSPLVTATHSITSILRALLRRATAAATPTILF